MFPWTRIAKHVCMSEGGDRTGLQELDFSELFAGSATLAGAFHDAGYSTAAADIKFGQGMDICKPSGFASLVV